MRNMQLLLPAILIGAAAFARPLSAQDVTGRCATPDSIAIRGLVRVSDASARGEIGLRPRTELSSPVIQRAVRGLYATGQYEADIRVSCDIEPAANRATLVFTLRERPMLADVAVQGVSALSSRTVRERVELLVGRPVDPALVARAVQRIDSLYEKNGYYLARVQPETTMAADGRAKLVFRVEEGRRLAISGVRINGNTRLSTRRRVGDEDQARGLLLLPTRRVRRDELRGRPGRAHPAALRLARLHRLPGRQGYAHHRP
jgi:outer membrane protein insertion porin family